MNKPKDWWGDPTNAEKWIKQVNKHNGDRAYDEQPDLVIGEVKKGKFKDILEVGSGTGHLIGSISEQIKSSNCYALDINHSLLAHVKSTYPKVNTQHGDIIDLPFEDNLFDLVFTYQVLQHVPPENIEQAIKELIRVSKGEVWMWEGIGKLDYQHGDQTHKAHNGSWVWHIDKLIECYEIKVPKNKNVKLDRQRLYKFKK